MREIFYLKFIKGIAPWGCISGVEQLDVHGTNVIYAKSKTGEDDETPLEPNHTQFIFIDDGTKHQYGAETKFRTRFEKAIAGESFTLQNNHQDSSDASQSEGKSSGSLTLSGKYVLLTKPTYFFY
jgi:hypothetical protein